MTVSVEQAAPHYRCVHDGHDALTRRPHQVLIELRFTLKKVVVDLCDECHSKLKGAK